MQIFKPVKTNDSLFIKHESVLKDATEAVHKRVHYTPFPEMPSPKEYGETAEADQKSKFEAQLNGKFDRLKQSSDTWLTSDEESPYTSKSLGLSYPAFSNVESYIKAADKASQDWKRTDAKTRAGILIESLYRLKTNFFELAFATMHTTGQAFLMSFQASGPHAADRALEAIAIGYQELTRFPDHISWEKSAGKFNLKLEKYGINVGRGLGLAIGCSTFPTWNTLPGLYASLIAGNAVIVKPHPKAIYPIAIVIGMIQDVLSENGFDPNLVMLAVDKADKQITKELAEHPAVRIIDFTGSNTFGSYVESLPNKIVFTEKAGINSVIIDSVDDLEAVAKNIAFSISLYSGQMCTAPQNIYVPESGIKTKDGVKSLAEVENAIVEATKGLVEHPKAGFAVAGAIQSKDTVERIKKAGALGGKVLLESKPIANPEFADARTGSPIIIEVSKDKRDLIKGEMFGPIVFIVPTKDTAESIELAASGAREHGAISCGAYTKDPAIMEQIAMQMAEAGTPVSFNLTGMVYVNQNSGFSDFHVTGGNPAGNASFTNPEFVVKRFIRVQSRVEGDALSN
ncbi:phenylacetic acid degradation protein PaaN [Candidatus Obscuribacterales bacterium]|nr:phenylacetic acid degradation protein PaaN [Candidatus Obscuribacterales bacterium]